MKKNLTVFLAIISKINMWPAVVIGSVILFYLLATGDLSWYTYALLAFVVAERAFIQLRLFVAKLVHDAMKKMIYAQFARAAQEGSLPPGVQVMQPPEFPGEDE